ncbi:MAG: DNA polymerase III subunit beta, partial [Candidatus Rokubacteria bacterium]|nr:DNA polymerase III subunit beta [Candidatus Rokubacteria bacterium]
RDAFSKGLQMVQNIVEPRQTLPILANVLLETEGDTLRVTATDLAVGACVSVPAKVASAGAITLSARKLGEIVKELPAAPLSLKVQENAWVVLRCGGVSYKLVGLPPEDFPAVVPTAGPAWIPLEGKALKEMLTRTAFAMSHDESRYALNGVLFSLQSGRLRVVATDGHRLALASRPLPNGEGQFPNYEQVVPKGHPCRLVVSRSALAAALRRVSVLSEERTKPVKVLLSPGSLKLTAQNPELGEAEESLPVDYSGEELAIGFNSRYVLDALGAIEADEVVAELKDALSPGIIRSLEGEEYFCVIMPMRI